MGAIREVIGGVGIIVSILYLALEINQNTESVQAANHLALIEQLGVVRSWNAMDVEFADIVIRGNDDFESLSAAERFRFSEWVNQHFDIWELAFSMNQRALVPTDIINAFDEGYCRGMAEENALVFDFGEWRNEVASKKHPDGTLSFVTIRPGIEGLEFVVGGSATRH